MGKVNIRNDTDGWNSQGLVAVFDSLGDRAQLRREPIRASDATDLLLVLREAQVLDSDLVIESPEDDRSDGAVTADQFARLHEVLGHSRPTTDERIPA